MAVAETTEDNHYWGCKQEETFVHVENSSIVICKVPQKISNMIYSSLTMLYQKEID